MNDETVSLREHFIALLDERELRYEQRFEAQQQAIAKAELAADHRAETANEIRGVMDDLTRQMMPRVEAVARFTMVEDKIDAINVAMSERAGTGAGVRTAWGWLIAAVGLFVSLASVWFIFAPAVKAAQ